MWRGAEQLPASAPHLQRGSLVCVWVCVCRMSKVLRGTGCHTLHKLHLRPEAFNLRSVAAPSSNRLARYRPSAWANRAQLVAAPALSQLAGPNPDRLQGFSLAPALIKRTTLSIRLFMPPPPGLVILRAMGRRGATPVVREGAT